MVKKKSEELEAMRQELASDFHDGAGNLLAAISHQAGILKLKLGEDHPLYPTLEQMSTNCDLLYSSGKDLLWSITNDSTDPLVLFQHLTAFGQSFYNQFEIAFSALPLDQSYCDALQIDSSASRHLIFVFKEAMTNVAKHSGATEVKLKITLQGDFLNIVLQDNGIWKPIDENKQHYGLMSIKSRSEKSNFDFKCSTNDIGTFVEVNVPVSLL